MFFPDRKSKRKSLSKLSQARLMKLIKSSYVRVQTKYQASDDNEDISFVICQIYSKKESIKQFLDYKQELISLGQDLRVEGIQLITVEIKDLVILKEQAELNNDLKLWQLYLNLQYLF